jgi:hypothetical protein
LALKPAFVSGLGSGGRLDYAEAPALPGREAGDPVLDQVNLICLHKDCARWPEGDVSRPLGGGAGAWLKAGKHLVARGMSINAGVVPPDRIGRGWDIEVGIIEWCQGGLECCPLAINRLRRFDPFLDPAIVFEAELGGFSTEYCDVASFGHRAGAAGDRVRKVRRIARHCYVDAGSGQIRRVDRLAGRRAG